MSLPHGFTQKQRDRLVSLVFAKLDQRDKDVKEKVRRFVDAQAIQLSVIPEVVGFQVLNKYEILPGHFIMKGVYCPPLIHDSENARFISIPQKSSTHKSMRIDMANYKSSQGDWIVDYKMFFWRLNTLKSFFLGKPIWESLHAAQYVDRRRCPPHEKGLKAIFVILVNFADVEDDEKEMDIRVKFEQEVENAYPMVFVNAEEVAN